MILTLFGVLVAIALILIGLGLFNPNESAQAIIGFLLLFFLSLIILNNGLEYESGSIINTTYSYNAGEVYKTDQVITNTYDLYNDDSTHRVGWYLTLASAVGLIGVIFSIGYHRYKTRLE